MTSAIDRCTCSHILEAHYHFPVTAPVVTATVGACKVCGCTGFVPAAQPAVAVDATPAPASAQSENSDAGLRH